MKENLILKNMGGRAKRQIDERSKTWNSRPTERKQEDNQNKGLLYSSQKAGCCRAGPGQPSKLAVIGSSVRSRTDFIGHVRWGTMSEGSIRVKGVGGYPRNCKLGFRSRERRQVFFALLNREVAPKRV